METAQARRHTTACPFRASRVGAVDPRPVARIAVCRRHRPRLALACMSVLLSSPGLAFAGDDSTKPAPGVAEILNYDYVYLSRNGTESDQQSGGGTAAGGYKSVREHLHVFGSYDDGAMYAGSHPNWDYDLKTLRVGAGGHFFIGKRTVFAPSVSIFYSHGTVMDASWSAPHRISGTGYIAQFELRHAVNRWLELTAAARRTKSIDGSSNELIGGVMLHVHRNWAFGVMEHQRDHKASTELTVRYYY